MSLYQVQKLLFHLARSEEDLARYQADREAVLARHELSARELRALRENDVGELYAMGVHPLLLLSFGARAGLRWPEYIRALREAEPRRRETA